MLTPAQRKIKQELEELKLKGLLSGEEEALPEDSKEHSPKFVWIGIGILLFICILSLTLMKLNPRESFETYINKEHAYNLESSALLNSCLQTNPDKIYYHQVQKRQNRLLDEINSLNPPKELKDHKLDTVRVLEQRILITSFLLDHNERSSDKLDTLLLELEVKEALAEDSLTHALDENGISLKQQEDELIELMEENH